MSERELMKVEVKSWTRVWLQHADTMKCEKREDFNYQKDFWEDVETLGSLIEYEYPEFLYNKIKKETNLEFSATEYEYEVNYDISEDNTTAYWLREYFPEIIADDEDDDELDEKWTVSVYNYFHAKATENEWFDDEEEGLVGDFFLGWDGRPKYMGRTTEED